MVAKGPDELVELERTECLERLATVHVGRVGITVGALPVILPVNFVLVEERMFFRTTAGTKLDAATTDSVIAFQADAYSPDGAAGWSVLAIGRCSRADGEGRVAAIANRRLVRHWSPMIRRANNLVEVEASTVTGRRFGAADNPWLLLH